MGRGRLAVALVVVATMTTGVISLIVVVAGAAVVIRPVVAVASTAAIRRIIIDVGSHTHPDLAVFDFGVDSTAAVAKVDLDLATGGNLGFGRPAWRSINRDDGEGQARAVGDNRRRACVTNLIDRRINAAADG